MTDIPELTEDQLARAIPGRVRRRLIKGQFETGADVVALRKFVPLTQAQFADAWASASPRCATGSRTAAGRRGPHWPSSVLPPATLASFGKTWFRRRSSSLRGAAPVVVRSAASRAMWFLKAKRRTAAEAKSNARAERALEARPRSRRAMHEGIALGPGAPTPCCLPQNRQMRLARLLRKHRQLIEVQISIQLRRHRGDVRRVLLVLVDAREAAENGRDCRELC